MAAGTRTLKSWLARAEEKSTLNKRTAKSPGVSWSTPFERDGIVVLSPTLIVKGLTISFTSSSNWGQVRFVLPREVEMLEAPDIPLT
jgi:hypothetical protein